MLKKLDSNNLKIVVYPDPILRKKARPVAAEDFGPELAALAQKMIELMVKHSGVGLAAPQVGLSARLIVVSVTGKPEDAEVIVNPELSNLQGESDMEEGCLSIPGVRANVRRANSLTLAGQDLQGNRFTAEVNDYAAVVLQHECDHLDGVLFIDRLNSLGKLSCRKGLKNLEREYQPAR